MRTLDNTLLGKAVTLAFSQVRQAGWELPAQIGNVILGIDEGYEGDADQEGSFPEARFRQGCHRQAPGTTPGRPSLGRDRTGTLLCLMSSLKNKRNAKKKSSLSPPWGAVMGRALGPSLVFLYHELACSTHYFCFAP